MTKMMLVIQHSAWGSRKIPLVHVSICSLCVLFAHKTAREITVSATRTPNLLMKIFTINRIIFYRYIAILLQYTPQKLIYHKHLPRVWAQ